MIDRRSLLAGGIGSISSFFAVSLAEAAPKSQRTKRKKPKPGICRAGFQRCKEDRQCCGLNFCAEGSCSCIREGICFSNRDCCTRVCKPNGQCQIGDNPRRRR